MVHSTLSRQSTIEKVPKHTLLSFLLSYHSGSNWPSSLGVSPIIKPRLTIIEKLKPFLS